MLVCTSRSLSGHEKYHFLCRSAKTRIKFELQGFFIPGMKQSLLAWITWHCVTANTWYQCWYTASFQEATTSLAIIIYFQDCHEWCSIHCKKLATCMHNKHWENRMFFTGLIATWLQSTGVKSVLVGLANLLNGIQDPENIIKVMESIEPMHNLVCKH